MSPPLRIDILTTFPEMFGPEPGCALNISIPGRARAAGAVEWHARNIREFTSDKHQKTDDRPFGGGPGMVMMCQPLFDAVTAVEALDERRATRILLTPQGVPLHQRLVERLATLPRLLLIAGHYEGIDERLIDRLAPMEVSVGDYVLSGGELGAMILIDSVCRLLPGVLGDELSAHQDSFGIAQPVGKVKPPAERLLDCPHYTKPRQWDGRDVPEVLLSGNHLEIAKWRLNQRIVRTQARRPDLLGAPAAASPALPASPPPDATAP